MSVLLLIGVGFLVGFGYAGFIVSCEARAEHEEGDFRSAMVRDDTPRPPFSLKALFFSIAMFAVGFACSERKVFQEKRAKKTSEVMADMLYELEQHDPTASGWGIQRYVNGKPQGEYFRGGP